MLHIIAIIFKLSWLLALFRLATTVFHLEFGISRHYLRLLEIVFRIGQEKFRMKKGATTDDDDGDDDHDDQDDDDEGEKEEVKEEEEEEEEGAIKGGHSNGNSNSSSSGGGGGGGCRGGIRRPSSLGNLVDFTTMTMTMTRIGTKRKTAIIMQTPKTRRISTPDGPPVFLLDQCDYEDDDDDDDNDDYEDFVDLKDDYDRHDDDACRPYLKGNKLDEQEQQQQQQQQQTPKDRNSNSNYDNDEIEDRERAGGSGSDKIVSQVQNYITDESRTSLVQQLSSQSHGGTVSSSSSSSLVHQSTTTTTTSQESSSCSKLQQQKASKISGSRGKQHEFQLYDPCKLVVKGISAIIDDDVIKRFTPEQLKSWNLLTRTNAKNYQFMSRSLGLFWLLGLFMRYLILLPMRIMFTVTGLVWLISTMSLIGFLPKRWRPRPYRLMSLMSFRMLACGLTSRLEFHNSQFRAQLGDICVANHTSPLDVVLLACDNCYALVGQRHGGILGILEFALSRATEHVWFDRAEMRDRQLVTRRLKEHIDGKSNLPVLIFPEGTCINNSAVMMFRKGSFETSDRVCPVAIKYDPRFGDPFWNSSKQGYVLYLLMMMSSWAIKCDVWYLPPMERLDGETSFEFANRVKAEIAKQGGLEDLAWDGQLKRSAPKTLWRYQQQEDFANRLKLE